MVEHRLADDRLLRLSRDEEGAVTVESLAAMAVLFLLLVVVTQAAFLLVARDTTQTAVNAAARRGGRPEASLGVEASRLATEVRSAVPGALGVTASLREVGDEVVAEVEFGWRAPGPNLFPIRLRVTAGAPIVVPP